MIELLAQSAPDPSTGIFAALIQLGGLGILSAVLLYLNQQDRADRKEERNSYHASLSKALATFENEQKLEREECRRQYDSLSAAYHRQQETLVSLSAAVSSLQRNVP